MSFNQGSHTQTFCSMFHFASAFSYWWLVSHNKDFKRSTQRLWSISKRTHPVVSDYVFHDCTCTPTVCLYSTDLIQPKPCCQQNNLVMWEQQIKEKKGKFLQARILLNSFSVWTVRRCHLWLKPASTLSVNGDRLEHVESKFQISAVQEEADKSFLKIQIKEKIKIQHANKQRIGLLGHCDPHNIKWHPGKQAVVIIIKT